MKRTFWTIATYRTYGGKLDRKVTKHDSYEEALADAKRVHVNSSLLFVEVHNGNHSKRERIYTK